MTEEKCRGRRVNLQELFIEENDKLKELLQEILETEMTEVQTQRL